MVGKSDAALLEDTARLRQEPRYFSIKAGPKLTVWHLSEAPKMSESPSFVPDTMASRIAKRRNERAAYR